MEPTPILELTRLHLSDGRLTTFTPNAESVRQTFLPAMNAPNTIVLGFGMIYITADENGKEILVMWEGEDATRIVQIHGSELEEFRSFFWAVNLCNWKCDFRIAEALVLEELSRGSYLLWKPPRVQLDL